MAPQTRLQLLKTRILTAILNWFDQIVCSSKEHNSIIIEYYAIIGDM